MSFVMVLDLNMAVVSLFPANLPAGGDHLAAGIAVTSVVSLSLMN